MCLVWTTDDQLSHATYLRFKEVARFEDIALPETEIDIQLVILKFNCRSFISGASDLQEPVRKGNSIKNFS